MRKQHEWGFLMPYLVTGILNEHPRAGIARRKTKEKDKYAEFYKEMLDSSQ